MKYIVYISNYDAIVMNKDNEEELCKSCFGESTGRRKMDYKRIEVNNPIVVIHSHIEPPYMWAGNM